MPPEGAEQQQQTRRECTCTYAGDAVDLSVAGAVETHEVLGSRRLLLLLKTDEVPLELDPRLLSLPELQE